MDQAGGQWEPGSRRWLIEPRRIGPLIRRLERVTDPLFRQAGMSLDGGWLSWPALLHRSHQERRRFDVLPLRLYYIRTAMTSVTYAHRHKLPPRRKKAQPAAITVPKIVPSISRKQARLASYARRNRPPDATSEGPHGRSRAGTGAATAMIRCSGIRDSEKRPRHLYAKAKWAEGDDPVVFLFGFAAGIVFILSGLWILSALRQPPS